MSTEMTILCSKWKDKRETCKTGEFLICVKTKTWCLFVYRALISSTLRTTVRIKQNAFMSKRDFEEKQKYNFKEGDTWNNIDLLLLLEHKLKCWSILVLLDKQGLCTICEAEVCLNCTLLEMDPCSYSALGTELAFSVRAECPNYVCCPKAEDAYYCEQS